MSSSCSSRQEREASAAHTHLPQRSLALAPQPGRPVLHRPLRPGGPQGGGISYTCFQCCGAGAEAGADFLVRRIREPKPEPRHLSAEKQKNKSIVLVLSTTTVKFIKKYSPEKNIKN